MSKFDFDVFFGANTYDLLAVSKEKYTKEQAVGVAKRELCISETPNDYYLAIGEAYVRYRAGRNQDNEPCVGWWLEYEEHKRSCPCWVFHILRSLDDEVFLGKYKYIKIEDLKGAYGNERVYLQRRFDKSD